MNASETDRAYTELKHLMLNGFDNVKQQIEDVKEELKQDIAAVKEDVEIIASVNGLVRDPTGKLKART